MHTVLIFSQLIAITVAMEVYVPPNHPQQVYTQGYWYGVLAAGIYCICAMLLMINMLGYFMGHYPQHFNLTDSQKTLILQSMMFFIWLGGGAAVFSRLESDDGIGEFNWSYTNALYFCDVTILTVGFGDLYVTSDYSRGLVFPYSVGGIIMLGLVISSISKFAGELGSDNIVQKHIDRSRARTFERSVSSVDELQKRTRELELENGQPPNISGPFDPVDRSSALQIDDDKEGAKEQARNRGFAPPSLARTATNLATGRSLKRAKPLKTRLIVLEEERDRFNAMRDIQSKTQRWKRWFSLSMSAGAFGILWCLGAVVFWMVERSAQGMTYFEALYFCYVSLLTIGYGDLAPKSNFGRPFFVVWSLIAVPTITILISDMGDTVINGFKQSTSALADFTVLPQEGAWRRFLDRHKWLLNRLEARKAKKEAEKRQQDAAKRQEEGFAVGPDPDEDILAQTPTVEQLAEEEEHEPSDFELARKLAQAIRRTANDMREEPPRRYVYEEWVEFTKLIRFTKKEHHADEVEEEDLIEWDWIGEDSPMMARQSEPEFVLDRLCESMGRYIRQSATPEATATGKRPDVVGDPSTEADRSTTEDNPEDRPPAGVPKDFVFDKKPDRSSRVATGSDEVDEKKRESDPSTPDAVVTMSGSVTDGGYESRLSGETELNRSPVETKNKEKDNLS